MKNHGRYMLVFGLLGGLFISSGMLLKDYFEWSRASKILFDEWTDYKLGDKKVVLWGSERDLLIGKQTFKTKIGKFLRNEIWF